MKINQIDIINNKNEIFFQKHFGILLVKSKKPNKRKTLPEIACANHQKVLKPFLLKETKVPDFSTTINDKRNKIYSKLMVFTCKYSFFLAKILTYFPFLSFNSTAESINAFQKVYPSSLNQRTLCLPRTLFALATSKSFKKRGTAFIGVFLPSRKMHAWIIEDNKNPDPHDDVWICYQPVAAITKS